MRWGTALAVAIVMLPFLIGAALQATDPGGIEEFRFQDPAIDESSGLVVLSSGHVVTANDSGDSARVFTVDPASGETTSTTSWPGEAVDVEALAPAPGGAVWVGDIGDNSADRDSVQVIHLPLDGSTATTYDLTYPDGSHDAEALLANPITGRLYVVTKGVFGGQVMAAPSPLRPDRPNRLEQVGSAGSLVTDGAFLPGAGAVVLRSYDRAWVLSADSWQTLASWRLPRQQQGEGLAVDTTGRMPTLLLSSEGARAEVLREPLPPAAIAADMWGSPLWRAVRLLRGVPGLG